MLGTSNLLSTIFYLKSYLNPSLTKYPHKVQLKIPSSQIGQARRRSPATWQVPVQFAHSILWRKPTQDDEDWCYAAKPIQRCEIVVEGWEMVETEVHNQKVDY